ncbi:hypothetical protein BJ508DRAFT_328098 [Ascobolus immersus RN42]|uniref:Rhodopsin domain-containing protein n=1 Tax=Ascobolus immersus RN42 TaxID=1160509 RepID=A0A3N4I0M8_ASCIM|nr:hypothetical protein BJ508DRAFT_328098 [Ascobolus immersus RN42]
MAPYKEFASFLSSSPSSSSYSSPHSTTTSSPGTLGSLTSIPHHDPEKMAERFLEYLTKTSDPSYHPADRGPMVLQFSIATTILTSLAVIFRFWGRKAITKRWTSDDWAILVANGWMLASTILNCIGIHQGAIGKHLSDFVFLQPFTEMEHTTSTVTFAIKLAFAYQLLYLLTLLFIKLSLLLFYRRLLGPNTGGPLIPIIYGTMGALVVYTIISLFLLIFQCKPVRAYWTPEIHTQFCPSWEGGLRRLYFGVLVVSVGSDFWVLGMPVAIVWKLSISGWKKVGCVIVFSLGIVACVAAAIRLYLVHTRPMYKDITWDFVLLVFWGQAEIAMAIICACLPALKQLFEHLFKKVKAKSIRSSSSDSSEAPSSVSRRRAQTVEISESLDEKRTMHQFLDSETKSLDLEKAMSGASSSSTSSHLSSPSSSSNPTQGVDRDSTHIIHQYQPPTHPPLALHMPTRPTTPPTSPISPTSPTSPISPASSTKPLLSRVISSSPSTSSSSSVKSIGTFAASPIAAAPKQAKSRMQVREPKKGKTSEFEGFDEWEKRFTWDTGKPVR